jgi:transposase-like protein
MQQLQYDAADLQKVGIAKASAGFHSGKLVWAESAHWMIDQLHTDGKRCPHCGVEIADEARLRRWYLVERIKCSSADCGRFYTSTTNTELSGSTLDPRELYLLKCLIEWGVSPETIITIIPVNKETVVRWEKRFQVMEQLCAR